MYYPFLSYTTHICTLRPILSYINPLLLYIIPHPLPLLSCLLPSTIVCRPPPSLLTFFSCVSLALFYLIPLSSSPFFILVSPSPFSSILTPSPLPRAIYYPTILLLSLYHLFTVFLFYQKKFPVLLSLH